MRVQPERRHRTAQLLWRHRAAAILVDGLEQCTDLSLPLDLLWCPQPLCAQCLVRKPFLLPHPGRLRFLFQAKPLRSALGVSQLAGSGARLPLRLLSIQSPRCVLKMSR